MTNCPRGARRARGRAARWKVLLDPLCEQAATHLTSGGNVLIVHSSLAGGEATLRGLRDSGLRAEVVARRRGPLGPIASARAQLLEERGLLKPGIREEELLVVRGTR